MLIGKGDFDGIEVLALDILHQSHFHHVLVADGADVGRDSQETSQLGSSPSALTGDNLESVFRYLSQGDGLDDTDSLDAFSQFVQGFLVKFATRLVGVRFYLVERYLIDGAAALGANAFC